MKRITLLILVSINTAFGWVIEGFVNPHFGTSDTQVVLNYIINDSYSGNARLKICLDKYDFNNLEYDYDCDILLREINVTMPQAGEEIFNLAEEQWLYRFCLKLYTNYTSSPYSDCDNDNTFFLTSTQFNPSETIDLPELIISVYSPDSVMQNQQFTSYVNIHNQGVADKEVLVYSYAYNGSDLISEGLLDQWKKTWTANQKTIIVPSNGFVTVTLVNRVNLTGFFDYNIRVRHGGEAIDTRRKINVSIEMAAIASIDSIDYCDPELIVCVKNLGNADANATLKIIAYNLSIEENFLINPKRTVEKQFIIPQKNFIHTLLLIDNAIIDEKTLTKDNELIVLEETLHNQTTNFEQTETFSIETVLYPLTVTICLASLYLLVRKT